MHYDIFYFSATGNTAFSVARIKNALESNGHTVSDVPLNTATPPPDKSPDRLIIAFPTLAGRPPGLVTRFCSSLPKAAATAEASVLAVAAGQAFLGPKVIARILRRKGYRLRLSGAAHFPENWTQIIPPPTDPRRGEETAKGTQQVDAFIAKLISGGTSLYTGRVSFIVMNILGMLFQLFGRRFLGKLFIADTSCNSCGLCARTCPAGAISMAGATPYWNFSCESCNRCINICPCNAINTSILRIILFLALIGAFCTVLILSYLRFAAPLVNATGGWPGLILNSVCYVLIITVSHVLPLTVIDRRLIFPLQNTTWGIRVFEKSFTKDYPRYVYPGYAPPIEHTAAQRNSNSNISITGRTPSAAKRKNQ
ncbi:MAG: EFR1 family ferrodoxin [Spirochaetales bacterium]|nr:EFR1 family ferrodoxin [Spirochaetales bacterium]